MAPNEKVCVYEKLGLRSKHRVKVFFFIVESVFLQTLWKTEDQCTSILHFADRPEVPYEVDFWQKTFSTKIGFHKPGRVMSWDVLVKKKFVQKVTQKCLGGLWDHPRPIPAYSGLFWTYFGPKSPKNLYINILIYIYIYIYIYISL